MSAENRKLETLATRYVTETRAQWNDLVELAASLESHRIPKAAAFLAKQTNTNPDTIQRKMMAAKHQLLAGATVESLKQQGQSKCLGIHTKVKKAERKDKLVPFPHKLTQPVRDDLDELCKRIARLLRVRTYDEAFELIMAQWADLTDDDILHLAGEGHEKAQSKPNGSVHTDPQGSTPAGEP